MNNQLLNDFVTRIRVNVETLSLEVSRNTIDTKQTFDTIKQMKNDLTHLYNLIKIEENIQQTQPSNR
jgi:phosphoglycerate-specific signal transduction histidine kinase